MIKQIARALFTLALALVAMGVAGCGGVQLRTASMPSESKRQFLGLKKVAVLPFNNPAGEKQGEDLIIDLMITELNIRRTFEQVEDPHYVKNVLKALKIRAIEELDLETVKKMGSEMKSQAVIIGNINAWGLGKGQDAAMQVSVTLTLMDTETGKPIWIGNGTRRASFTFSRAFGLDEGPTDLEVGREVVISLLSEMDGDIKERREAELVRIKEEEDAKLKAAAEAEKRRLREQLEKPAETVPAPAPAPAK